MTPCFHIDTVTCSNCNKGFDWKDRWVINTPKCDVCGSTATDHTQSDCEFNRGIVRPRKDNESTSVS